VTGHGIYVQHRHLSTLPLCIKYIYIVLGAAEDWSFGTKLDLVRSSLSKLVQSSSDPPAIVLLIRLDLIAHNTMLFSRPDNDGLVSSKADSGRGDGRVVGIVPPGRDSVWPELGSSTGVVRSDPNVPKGIRRRRQYEWKLKK